MGMRVWLRCAIEIHKHVLKANAELLGRIERHAHLSRLAGVLVPTDHVLQDDPSRHTSIARRILPYKACAASPSGASRSLDVSRT